MSKDKSVSESVSLVWRPIRYRAKWALEPEEVPHDDLSRNPHGHPALVAWSHAFNLVEHGGKEQEHDFGLPQYWTDDYMLGQNQPPPLVSRLVGPEGLGGAHSFIASIKNYPRLVKSTDHNSALPAIQGRVSEAVAELYCALSDKSLFMEQVVEVANTYAPMASSKLESDTLEAWQEFAVEMNFFLGLLAENSNLRQVRPHDYNSIYRKTVRDWVINHVAYRPGGRFVPIAEAFSKDRASVKEMRGVVASHLWKQYQHEVISQIAPSDTPGQYWVICGARGWAYKELWDAFTQGSHVKRCLNCDRIFVATRAHAKYCPITSTCRVHASRARRKEA